METYRIKLETQIFSYLRECGLSAGLNLPFIEELADAFEEHYQSGTGGSLFDAGYYLGAALSRAGLSHQAVNAWELYNLAWSAMEGN